MRIIIASLVLTALMAGGTLGAGPPAGTATANGYITLGDNIVMLPAPLKKGDRLIIVGTDGIRIFDRTVGTASTRFEDLGLGGGTYSVWMIRAGQNAHEVQVPLAAY